ncbi:MULTISPECIES: LysR family transcriptional regulator [unclassified Caballeronia]|uniref:LysR family transcriptional regulator n=1 Tax=unclassified Caballeronia TaxID=2646786 RepID=UPI00285CD59C|nr:MULTISPECIES: LysR family transcriptional regulator [unclassified Caballeronia]MDR5750736.1 LysR family transcriptional regulator [Caballeronia sp. LZ024]MDR5842231.1 LysR family transcriptional regulator [Caballeronia sp. LZ031]
MNPADLFALLPDMAVFARVVDAGNFSVAARQLGSTPSTVSRQIKRLEEALATRLLERSTRKVRVTESGQQVYRHCRDMAAAAAGAVDAAGQSVGRPQGRVALSAPSAYAKSVIHPLVPAFLAAYPDVDVQLFFSDHEIDPLASDLDLVIRATDRPPPGLAARPLGRIRWVLCAAHSYLHERGVPAHPRDLATHDCIYLGETADDNRWQFRRGNETASVTVKGRYIANHAGARLEAAQDGLGIANLPEFAAREALAMGSVARVLGGWDLEARAYQGPVWLLYPPNRFLPPKVRALIDFLAQRLG